MSGISKIGEKTRSGVVTADGEFANVTVQDEMFVQLVAVVGMIPPVGIKVDQNLRVREMLLQLLISQNPYF